MDMTPEARAEAVFSIFLEKGPPPVTELKYTNPYTLLVAVSLSAQSTDVSVNKATDALFRIVSTPQEMVELGEERLKTYISTIGLYNSKAKHVMKAAHALLERHGGEVPQDLDALKALPGVGVKTAKVVLNCAFGVPCMPVDTHVFRLASRIGLADQKTPEKTGEELERVISRRHLSHAHHHLILHGRYVCKARAPLCDACVIRAYCRSAPVALGQDAR